MKEIDTRWTAASPSDFPFLRTAINTCVTQQLCEEWAQDWKEDTKGRDLFRIAPTPTKKVLHIHKGLRKWTSALVVQMRTQKIGLRKFLYNRKVPGFDDPRCDCGRGTQNVLHLLLECPIYHRQRNETWRKEKRGKMGSGLDLKLILNDNRYARKAALFMQDTGLIGQFNGPTPNLDV